MTKVMIYFGKNKEQAKSIMKHNKGSVLANYGQSLLVETDVNTMHKLVSEGFGVRMIKDMPFVQIGGYEVNTTSSDIEGSDFGFRLSSSVLSPSFKLGTTYHILHLIGPMHPEWKKRLEDIGVTIFFWYVRIFFQTFYAML